MADGNSRAANGGGFFTPLASAPGYTPTGVAGGANWFGPGSALAPVAPPEVRGRSWDYPNAINQNQQKRKYEPITPDMLRGLAQAYGTLRIVIETRKDQMAALTWKVGNKVAGEDLTDEQKSAAAKIETFFEEPQKGKDWQTWLRKLLEDLFVLDAPTIYPRQTFGNALYELRILDGGTINLNVDPWGELPEPPAPAYQQILHGLGAVDYKADELIYRPRNPRPGKLFGFSPVEQIVTIVNIAIRREIWQLHLFTQGSLPDALVGTPDGWTPDQVRSFQAWWDSVQTSDAGGNRGVRFVPGEVAKGYVPTKDIEIFGAAEEWISRVICYAFSVSPAGFVKMMNRATATTQQEVSVEEGLQPIKAWVKGLIDFVIKTYFARDDLVLNWDEEEEIDQQAQSTMLINEVKAGLISIDEAREVKGMDLLGDGFDKPMAYTATGYVPVSIDDQMDLAQQKLDMLPPPTVVAPGGGGKGPGGQGGAPAAGGGGRPGGGAGSASLGPGAGGSKGKAGKLDESLELAKAALRPITPARPAGRAATVAIRKAVGAAFAKTATSAAKQVRKALGASKVAKVESKDGSGSVTDAAAAAAAANATAEEIVAKLDLSGLDLLVDNTESALFDLAVDSAMKALAQVGVDSNDELVNQVNARALAFARDRAAELVGKRWADDGELIDNPSAQYAIDESTREMLRRLIATGLDDNIGTPAIAKSIEESTAFSADRADLVARTEVSRANEQGKLDGWREAEATGVRLQKSWLTAGDEKVDEDICQANEDEGPIGIDADFQSGDSAPPGHPDCRCVLIPEVVEDDTGGIDGGDEDDG